mmetsp:Transcript_15433/g.42431  ORF Transcript_15433/g.42431 Transcript_15433/m.42431 type:complete len:301 (-) Transcript_15433:67-969(-)
MAAEASQQRSRSRSRSPRLSGGVPKAASDVAGLSSEAGHEGTSVVLPASGGDNDGQAAPQACAKPQVPAHWLEAPKRAEEPPSAAAATPSESGGALRPAAKGKGRGKCDGKGKAAAEGNGGCGDGADQPVTATALLAAAGRLDTGDANRYAEVGQLLRGAAVRIGSLERVVEELRQTVQAVHSMLGRTVQRFGGPEQPLQLQGEDGPKSFLVKKGDEDVQEAHRSAAQVRPTVVSSSAEPLSAEAKTKEEMNQARRARLERLEAQQNERKKQLEDSAAKSRAHDAMFEQRVGAAKPLGRL